ncbi:DUF4352 domain-containing protein [Streptomyces radicis]|uniref:DUF4352 domain-containing protein n=1 Tax=Streptomyces radicis TaxID=1750517 RepID=A0A3A9W8K7_9ACTN|nr:DUF4352 domain-containing protein [Streptomyces radicis]RKN08683.1 DUF4352 domain-containing protein [Streptomyces radicis]RKN21841.1 DUF4352 domain-containing protein [Streptomyces radicis]
MTATRSRRFAGRRRSAFAGAAAALLAMGALSACSSEEERAEEAVEEALADLEELGETTAGGAAGEDGAEQEIFAAGETAVFDNGVEYTVSAAEPYSPSEWAVGHTEGNEPQVVSLTVTNNGAETYDTSFILTTARIGEDGVEAELIIDDPVGLGPGGSVAPGQSATADYAFDIPAGEPSFSLTVEELLEFGATWDLTL